MFFSTGDGSPLRQLGLLVLRLGVSLPLIAAHGWGKLQMLLDGGGEGFPDPLGVGAEMSLTLAVFGELVAPAAVAVGLLTRLASLPMVVTFVVAFFVIHGDDPFASKELAFFYLLGSVTVLLTGPGRLSVDGVLGKRGEG